VKKITPVIILGFLIFLLVSCGAIYFSWGSSPACLQNCQPKIFLINKGESFSSVANRLEKEGFIRSALIFHFIAWREQSINKIQAGDFRLNPQSSPETIAQNITKGTLDIWVTLLEGWRREEIAQKLSSQGLTAFKTDEFLALTKNLEGRLFPDTYLIPREATAEKIVNILTQNFQKKVSEVDKDTLVMASIIEREIRNSQDRKIISGILWKRLKNNWPLQADATVQYAVASSKCKLLNANCSDWWPHNLTKQDLAIKSAYNTYLNQGLPPAPIANPGLGAIEAAMAPLSSDYWFYLSDSDGVTHYARTDQEQAQNIQKYLLP
jgi:UPF0755 protein